ncbi:MAG: type IV pilus assembly protein PilM [Candidatus Paceibacterota bacterium]|jgi:type IV pilus assembly protein PilM
MNNPFTNLFSSFFAPKEVSVLGIDLGPSSVKVVQLKKKGGKAVLETYGELSLGTYAGTDTGRSTVLGTDKLALAVKDLLKESNTTTLNSGMSIPIGSSLITFIKLPTTDERQLAEMVPMEARKYIPVPISEVSVDYWPIPKDETTISEFQNGQKVEASKETEVLLVVIHNDAINKNNDIQKLVGLNNTFSEIEIFSCMRAMLETSIAPQMIVDFGSNSTKAFVVEKGILRTSHIINRGAQDITLAISKSLGISFEEAEKIKRMQGIVSEAGSDKNILEVSSVTLDFILSEISRVLTNYYRKNGKKVSKVTLTGGGALLKGLREKAQLSFETPVELANPFSKVEYPAFLEEVLKDAGPEFAVAIGLAIRKLQEI